jgi:ABC-type branched-subunit amino acid transport system ATPase component
VFLIEHDMGVVMEISDHIIVLDYGVKISDGSADEVRKRPEGDRRVSRRGGRGSGQGRGEPEPRHEAPRVERRATRAEPLLSVRGVKTYYGKIVALRGVDIDVHAGKIVALIGANGAGKSTLMMTICGNPRARDGSITFDGEDITRLPTHQIMARSIAQSPEGPPHLSRA